MIAGDLASAAARRLLALLTLMAVLAVFVALAVGWWIMVPAAIVSVIGLVGWVMEYSFGRYSH